MSKKPIIICAQPIDRYFLWQVNLFVESCIQQGGFDEDRIHVLLYKTVGREFNNQDWDKLKQCYPKLNIYLYEDKGVQQHLGLYIPVLRPHLLWQHFLAFPKLKNETIIYTDCDILWTSKPDIEKFYDNDICYISNAESYLNVDYLNSKERDVLPEKLEEYKTRDILQELCNIIGVDKSKAIENNHNAGGVQYILKNMDADFWKKIEKDVISIRQYFLSINNQFFENENKGFQGWCADLWAILYNLWARNQEVQVVPEMDFAWSTDNIDRLQTTTIFHNAGITDTMQGGIPRFYKGKYHRGEDPTKDPHLDVILNNEESKKTCTWYYTNKLKELSEKYHLNY